MLARHWNPDYPALFAWRQEQVELMCADARLVAGARAYYKDRPIEFIEDWCDTFDPRNAGVKGKLVRMPMVMWKRQREFVQFLHGLFKTQTSGLVEKSRDAGATWLAVCFSVWLWLFWPGSSVGWGSRKEDLVDTKGDIDSIFEKIREVIKGLPRVLWPIGFNESHMTFMLVTNPENGASITGESGDNIGRGGRKLIYFKDESAHYVHPESIEGALSENTNIQVDMSSVNGLGNVFHRRREAGVEWTSGARMVRGKANVFIMDWRDDPRKDQAWYDEKKQKAEDEGLLHVFYQEIDRNYAASVEGTIILTEWIRSAIDAHKKIPGMDEGGWGAALDVADSGGDRNAFVRRKGVVLRHAEEWGARDTGSTARKAVTGCDGYTPMHLQYDCIGVGSGVKSEINRLKDENLVPRGLRFVPWDAGAAPMNPDDHVIPGDKETPLNKDFYGNFKAQGWWQLARRFEKTHKAVTQGVRYKTSELISIDSTIPKLRQLEKELAQPTMSKSARLKLIVDKQPEGTRSPNMGDAVMMCFHPQKPSSTYDTTLSWVE